MIEKEDTKANEPHNEVDNSKRNIVAALLGSLGVAALSSCTNDGSPQQTPDEHTRAIVEALHDTATVLWVDSIGTTPTNGDLRHIDGAASVIAVVKGFWAPGDGGGGVFFWVSSNDGGGTDDGGTIIVPFSDAPCAPHYQGSSGGCWKRIYSGPMNVRWFGAATAGDASQAVTRTCKAANRDSASVVTDGAVYFPPGTYYCNLVLEKDGKVLRGAGRATTIIRPFDPNEPLIRLLYRSYTPMTIEGLSFIGSQVQVPGATIRGNGITYGHDTEDPQDYEITFVFIKNCSFVGFNIAINRPYSNIELYVEDTEFINGNYHIWNSQTQLNTAPAGCMILSRCTFQGAGKACVVVLGGSSAGRATLRDCLIQDNPGFVVYLKGWALGYSDFVVENCWNEANATSTASVEIDGDSSAPTEFYFRHARAAKIRNTYINRITVCSHSFVDTEDCMFGDSYTETIDGSSQLVHRFPRTYSGALITQRLLEPRLGETNLATFKVRHPLGLSRGFSANVVAAINGNMGKVSYDGTREIQDPISSRLTTMGDSGVITAASQAITLDPTNTYFYFPYFVTQASKYYVWTLTYKVAGTAPMFQITGSVGCTANMALSATEWTTITGVFPIANNGYASPVFLREGDCVVHVGGFQVLEFDSLNKAKEFANAGVFALIAPREVYGISYPTTGSWDRGDRCWNSQPSAGGCSGWICVAGGPPAVWKEFGTISS